MGGEREKYNMSDASDTIVIKTPAGTKARWVRQSQSQGMKLSDWLVQQVDRPANKAAASPCPRCHSVVLTSDGPGMWQCAQCGLVA
jgi:ribosomal protein L37AE/L43A